MAAYRRVYDSRHLQADCQEPGSAPNPMLSNRAWATFTFYLSTELMGVAGRRVACSEQQPTGTLLVWSDRSLGGVILCRRFETS